jgi:hypothetical protein
MKKIIRKTEATDYKKWEKELDNLLGYVGLSVRGLKTGDYSLYPITDFWERGFTPEQTVDYIQKEMKYIEKASTKTAKCPICGGKYLVATGYCVSCKKKVAEPKKEKLSIADALSIKNEGAGGGFSLEVKNVETANIRSGDTFNVKDFTKMKSIRVTEATVFFSSNSAEEDDDISPMGEISKITWDFDSFYDSVERYGGNLEYSEINQFLFGQDLVSDAPSTLYWKGSTTKSYLPDSFPVKIGIEVDLRYGDSNNYDPYTLKGTGVFYPSKDLISFVSDNQNAGYDDFDESRIKNEVSKRYYDKIEDIENMLGYEEAIDNWAKGIATDDAGDFLEALTREYNIDIDINFDRLNRDDVFDIIDTMREYISDDDLFSELFYNISDKVADYLIGGIHQDYGLHLDENKVVLVKKEAKINEIVILEAGDKIRIVRENE